MMGRTLSRCYRENVSSDSLIRHNGPRHGGPARTSPYPTHRLAPPHSLVDLAREIERADEVLHCTTHGRLDELAEQIRLLQARAREIIAEAAVDRYLHRAGCSFSRRVGASYHLYRRENGSVYFSMLAPEEWKEPPHEFVGTFRLNGDRSWTAIEEPALKLRLAEQLVRSK